MSEIKQEVLDLAEKIKSGISISKDGTVTIAEDLYIKQLPESIDPKVLAEAQKHTSQFIAAAAYVMGDKALDIMKKNAEINEVSMEIPTVGKDALNFNFKRSREVPNVAGDGKITKYGSMTVKMDSYGTGSRGQLLKVKQELSDKATKAFGG